MSNFDYETKKLGVVKFIEGQLDIYKKTLKDAEEIKINADKKDRKEAIASMGKIMMTMEVQNKCRGAIEALTQTLEMVKKDL